MKRTAPLTRTAPPRRKKRLNPVGAKARREADAIAEFRRAVRERAGGLCELATPACPPGAHEGHHAHHRRLRSQGGGHEAENGLWLCSESHRYMHDNPAYAYRVGGMLRSGTREPCAACRGTGETEGLGGHPGRCWECRGTGEVQRDE